MVEKVKPPNHEEIELRAYELYQESGEKFSPTEYWLMAEQELTQQRATADATPVKKKMVVAGAGGVAKTDE